MLVVAQLPFAAVRLEVHGTEAFAPNVFTGKGAMPELVGRWKRQIQLALGPVGHVDLIPVQTVGGVGIARAKTGRIVLGLTDTVAVADACALGLQHRELLAFVDQHVVGRQPFAACAARLDAPRADDFTANFGAVLTPAGRRKDGVYALGAGIGFGFVVNAHLLNSLRYVNSPAKAFCKRDWRRSSRSWSLASQSAITASHSLSCLSKS